MVTTWEPLCLKRNCQHRIIQRISVLCFAASPRSLTHQGYLKQLANATCVHLALVHITVTPIWYGWTTQDRDSAVLSTPQYIWARVFHVSLCHLLTCGTNEQKQLCHSGSVRCQLPASHAYEDKALYASHQRCGVRVGHLQEPSSGP